MKRTIQTFIMIFIAFFLPITAISPIAAQSWYMPIIKKMNSSSKSKNGIVYKDNCSVITNGQAVRQIGLIAHKLVTYDSAHPQKQLQEIEAQLKHFETKLRIKEEKALLAIKQKFAIDQHEWDTLLQSIEKVKQVNRKAMQNPWPTIVHDVQLPAHVNTLITELCQNNNIHPKSIHLSLEPHACGNSIAQAISTVAFIENCKIADQYAYIPQRIEFFPRALKQSPEELKATCAHELEHIIQQHCVVRTVLVHYITTKHQLSELSVEKSEEFQKLIHIQEQQAEILSAIRDPHVAQCFMHKRADIYYPNYLYEKHYYHLSTIHMLWQLHAWVKFFHHGGLTQKIEEVPAKIGEYVAKFNNYFKNTVLT